MFINQRPYDRICHTHGGSTRLTQALAKLPVSLVYNPSFYRINTALVTIPLLVPGLLYTCCIEVESIEETGAADRIKILVNTGRSAVPSISAIVEMPMSELWE